MSTRIRLGDVADVFRPPNRRGDEAAESLVAEPDDIVIDMAGGGIDVEVVPDYEDVTGTHSLVIHPRADVVHPQWLGLWCRSAEFAALLTRHARGATLRSVPARELLEFAVPIPPRDVQERAAETVQHFAAAVNAQAALLSRLRDLQRAAEHGILAEALANEASE